MYNGADEAPPRQSFEVFEDLSARVAAQLVLLKDIVNREAPEFVKMIESLAQSAGVR